MVLHQGKPATSSYSNRAYCSLGDLIQLLHQLHARRRLCNSRPDYADSVGVPSIHHRHGMTIGLPTDGIAVFDQRGEYLRH